MCVVGGAKLLSDRNHCSHDASKITTKVYDGWDNDDGDFDKRLYVQLSCSSISPFIL